MIRNLFVAALLLFTPTFLYANVTIGTGGPGGTYYALVNDMQKVCGSSAGITNVSTGGSIDNIQQILDNKLNAGIVQFDVIRYYEEKDDGMSRLRVLFPLHVEEIHIVGLDKTYKEGGLFGFGAKSIELKSIPDLKGRKVVAWGGSVLSAHYFSQKLRLDYDVIEIDAADKTPAKTAAAMLAAGEAHAIFAVGGQPLGWLRDPKVFGKQFKLLSITPDILDQVKGTYNGAKLNYPNLNGVGVSTLGVQALLITRDYKTPDRIEELVGLRNCVNENLDKLRESTGVHPKWQSIDTTAESERWKKYDPTPVKAAPKSVKK